MTDLSKQGDLDQGTSMGEKASEGPRLAVVRGHDPVSSPAHYARLDPQPLDVIEAWQLNYHRGNALKYLARAGHKGGADDEVTDLLKAAAYLTREADRLKQGRTE